MRLDNVGDLKVIGSTIRAVAKAGAERLFKTESNDEFDSAFAFIIIRGEVTLALKRAGVRPEDLIRNAIDPTDDIVEAMSLVGFVFDADEADMVSAVFGPVTIVESDGYEQLEMPLD